MKYILIIVACLKLCSFSFADSYNYRTSYQRTQYNPRDDLEWSNYSYSIDEGQCSGTKLVDEDVKKDGEQYTYKKTSYTWTGRGMYYLTCVRVVNRMPRDKNAAEARLTTGGVGQGDVRIEMRSKDSQRTDFHVEIWGKETQSQASNMAVMMHTPSTVLYMNGKKYCECR